MEINRLIFNEVPGAHPEPAGLPREPGVSAVGGLGSRQPLLLRHPQICKVNDNGVGGGGECDIIREEKNVQHEKKKIREFSQIKVFITSHATSTLNINI